MEKLEQFDVIGYYDTFITIKVDVDKLQNDEEYLKSIISDNYKIYEDSKMILIQFRAEDFDQIESNVLDEKEEELCDLFEKIYGYDFRKFFSFNNQDEGKVMELCFMQKQEEPEIDYIVINDYNIGDEETIRSTMDIIADYKRKNEKIGVVFINENQKFFRPNLNENMEVEILAKEVIFDFVGRIKTCMKSYEKSPSFYLPPNAWDEKEPDKLFLQF